MSTSASRPYTKEETIQNLLTTIHEKIHFLDKEDGDTIAHMFFASIDGDTELPGFQVNALLAEPKDIGGELHSLILRQENELNEMEQNKIISPILRSFIERVKQLIKEFDSTKNKESDELIANFFGLIDYGIDGTLLELKAISCPEDIELYKSEGENYYPIEGINIAGDLAKRYRQLYLEKNNRKQENEPER